MTTITRTVAPSRFGKRRGKQFPAPTGTASTISSTADSDIGAPNSLSRVRPQVKRVYQRQGRRAAIVDLDGTLLDSKEAHSLSWLVAMHDAGHDVEVAQLRPCIGLPEREVLAQVCGVRADTEEGIRIRRRRAELFRTWYMRRLLPFLGTRALLQRMRREGLRLIALTTSPIDEAVGLIHAAGIGDLLDDAVVQDDASAFSRYADLVEAAIAQCATVRESIVMLGDTPYDVEESGKAGIGVVALRCGGWRDGALEGAAAIYDDPGALLAQFDESLFATHRPAVRAPLSGPLGSEAPGLTLVQ